MFKVLNDKKICVMCDKYDASSWKDFETKHMGIFLAEMYAFWKQTQFWIRVLYNPWPFLIETTDTYIFVFSEHSQLTNPVFQC